MSEHPPDSHLPPISGPGPEGNQGCPHTSPQIGGYEITGPLGQGGMGTVWRALQLGTRREVALKVLGRGAFGSEKARFRFEREVELTARLEHPNIARIYDSGHHNGVYYYAMELINGVELDRHAKEQGLTQQQILELMETVCWAVQHAHQSGVIHRDLKPSNILVTEDGQPHILDFGVAKAFMDGDSDLSISTDGDPAGTPAYMSPEQAAGHADKVDTRSDVYTLGVILFRLLTGESPHDLSGTRYEVLCRVAEQGARRPREISRDVDRELEALLLKALAHDQNERYPSAGALALDIENYLAGEPLTAQAPTVMYFLRKRIRKYQVPVAIVSSVLALLAGITVIAYIRIAGERVKAVAAERLARRRLSETEKARDDARKEASRAKATYDFLQGLLASVDPRIAEERETLLRESLDNAVTSAATELADQPELEAKVRTTTGRIYLALGQVNSAEVQFSRALELRRRLLGQEHPDTLTSTVNLAVTLMRKDNKNVYWAEPMLKRALEAQQRVLGEEHPDTLRTMSDLGSTLQKAGKLDKAEAMLRQCLDTQRRVLGESHPDAVSTMTVLGGTLAKAGKLDEAKEMLRECLAIESGAVGYNHPDTLDSMMNLAKVLRTAGELSQAEEMLRRCVPQDGRSLLEEHIDTLKARADLALTLLKEKKFAEAEEVLSRSTDAEHSRMGQDVLDAADDKAIYAAISDLGTSNPAYLERAESQYRQVLDTRRRLLGEEHPNTLRAMMLLPTAFLKRGKLQEAEEMWRKCLHIQRQTLGDDHPDTLCSMMSLAATLEREGKLDEAEELQANILKVCRRIAEEGRLDALNLMMSMPIALADIGEFDEAEVQQRRILEACRLALGDKHPYTLKAVGDLVVTLTRKGKLDEAESMWRGNLETVPPAEGAESILTESICRAMGIRTARAEPRLTLRSFVAREDVDVIEPQLRRILELHRRIPGEEHALTLAWMNDLGIFLTFNTKLKEAEELYRQNFETRRRTLGEENNSTLGAMDEWGLSLTELGRYEEAEAVFRQSQQIRRRVLGEDNPDTLNPMDRFMHCLWDAGVCDKAEALARENIEIRRRTQGKEHPDTLNAVEQLASRLAKNGEFQKAEVLYRELLEIRRRSQGDDNPNILWAMSTLAGVLEEAAKLDEAEELRREILEIQRRLHGEEDERTLEAMNELAVLFLRGGKLDEAETVNRQILEFRRRFQGEEHPNTLWAMSNLAVLLDEKGKQDEADALRRQMKEMQEQALERRLRRDEPSSRATPSESARKPSQPVEEGTPGTGEKAEILTPAKTPVTLPLYDGFDGELGLNWQTVRPEECNFSFTDVPSALTITAEGYGTRHFTTYYDNKLLVNCPGGSGEDFQVTACISSFKNKDKNFTNEAGLTLYADDHNWLEFVYGYGALDNTPRFAILAWSESPQAGRQLHALLRFRVPQESERMWLRIAKQGSRYTFSTSTDGGTFLLLRFPATDSTGLFQGALVWGDGVVQKLGLFCKLARRPGASVSFDFFEISSIPARSDETREQARSTTSEGDASRTVSAR